MKRNKCKKRRKIICVGFSKTGTSSLHIAFRRLGISSCHHTYRGISGVKWIQKAEAKGKRLLHYMPFRRAYSDMNLYKWYERLSTEYPDALFILTTRPYEERADSKIRHDQRWNRNHPELPQRDVSPARREGRIEEQKKVETEIRNYFFNSDRFLEISITEGEGWEKLCPFVEVDEPEEPFPKSNRS